MKLKELYARTSDKAEDKKDKKIISDDTYALCEFLEQLTNRMVESNRISLFKRG